MLADQIVALAPDLVALQEVTLYRRQVPERLPARRRVPNADGGRARFPRPPDGGARRARRRLPRRRRGAQRRRRAAGRRRARAALFDLRLTDRDVILARDAVQTANFVALPFATKFSFIAGGSGGVPIALTRSTSRVDATSATRTSRSPTRTSRSSRCSRSRPRRRPRCCPGSRRCPDPVLLLGDFNSEPGMNSYPLLTAPFNDAWRRRRRRRAGRLHLLPGRRPAQRGLDRGRPHRPGALPGPLSRQRHGRGRDRSRHRPHAGRALAVRPLRRDLATSSWFPEAGALRARP